MNIGRLEQALFSLQLHLHLPTSREIMDVQTTLRGFARSCTLKLEDVVEHSKLDALNHKMVEDALRLQAAGDASPYNYNKGNIQQDPPATKQYFEPSIFLNPIATQVTSSILGPRPRLSFLSGNTTLPPTPDCPPQSQPIHSDADIDHPNCPFALVVNVGLVEMTPENGSTEVWLGSHLNSGPAAQEGKHGERASGRIKEALLVERAKERPLAQPRIKKGSTIVRDLRLWHGGKPNFTDATRVMLAMIHFAPWYRSVTPSDTGIGGVVDFRLATNYVETQCKSNLPKISARSWTCMVQTFRSRVSSCRRRTSWRGT
jgi:hypothetical protein